MTSGTSWARRARARRARRARTAPVLGAGRARRGFTLFEFALVLCALALVAAFAVNSFFSRSEVTLENAARLLASDLQAARTCAALTRERLTVEFHADGGGYHVRHLLDAPDELPARRFPADGVFEDVRVASVRLARGDHLEFDPAGLPSTDAWITLVHDGVTRTVLVDAATGWIAPEGRR